MQPDKDEMMRRMRAGRFRENNGVTITTINMVNSPERYASLRDVALLLTETAGGTPMTIDEVIKSVNFLHMAGYIILRDIGTKATVELADTELYHTEAKVSEKGVRLLSYGIKDDEVVFVWR